MCDDVCCVDEENQTSPSHEDNVRTGGAVAPQEAYEEICCALRDGNFANITSGMEVAVAVLHPLSL